MGTSSYINKPEFYCNIGQPNLIYVDIRTLCVGVQVTFHHCGNHGYADLQTQFFGLYVCEIVTYVDFIPLTLQSLRFLVVHSLISSSTKSLPRIITYISIRRKLVKFLYHNTISTNCLTIITFVLNKLHVKVEHIRYRSHVALHYACGEKHSQRLKNRQPCYA